MLCDHDLFLQRMANPNSVSSTSNHDWFCPDTSADLNSMWNACVMAKNTTLVQVENYIDKNGEKKDAWKSASTYLKRKYIKSLSPKEQETSGGESVQTVANGERRNIAVYNDRFVLLKTYTTLKPTKPPISLMLTKNHFIAMLPSAIRPDYIPDHVTFFGETKKNESEKRNINPRLVHVETVIQTLTVDMVPYAAWYRSGSNLCNNWHRVSKYVRDQFNETCIFCHDQTQTGHAHEQFDFIEHDESVATYRLARVVYVCEDCHSAIHYGRSKQVGKTHIADRKLKEVRGWCDDELRAHTYDAFVTWRHRNKFKINVDLSLLTESGITIDHRSSAYLDGVSRGVKYFAENARSNRAACKLCRLTFTKGSLKFGCVNVGYPHAPDFYHVECFVMQIGEVTKLTFSDFTCGNAMSPCDQRFISNIAKFMSDETRSIETLRVLTEENAACDSQSDRPCGHLVISTHASPDVQRCDLIIIEPKPMH
jgi:hypothetical protein